MSEFVKCILTLPDGSRLLAHHCRKQGNTIYATFGTFKLNHKKEWVWICNDNVKVQVVDKNFTTKDLVQMRKKKRNVVG